MGQPKESRETILTHWKEREGSVADEIYKLLKDPDDWGFQDLWLTADLLKRMDKTHHETHFAERPYEYRLKPEDNFWIWAINHIQDEIEVSKDRSKIEDKTFAINLFFDEYSHRCLYTSLELLEEDYFSLEALLNSDQLPETGFPPYEAELIIRRRIPAYYHFVWEGDIESIGNAFQNSSFLKTDQRVHAEKIGNLQNSLHLERTNRKDNLLKYLAYIHQVSDFDPLGIEFLYSSYKRHTEYWFSKTQEALERVPKIKDEIPLFIRQDVLQRDQFACQHCGRKAPDVVLHIDHIIPESKGGLTELDNLQVLCADCNIGKSNRYNN